VIATDRLARYLAAYAERFHLQPVRINEGQDLRDAAESRETHDNE